MFCYNWSEFPTSWNSSIFMFLLKDVNLIQTTVCIIIMLIVLMIHCSKEHTLMILDWTVQGRKVWKRKAIGQLGGKVPLDLKYIHKHTKSSYAYHHYLYNECHTMRDAMLCFSLLPIMVALCDSSYLWCKYTFGKLVWEVID